VQIEDSRKWEVKSVDGILNYIYWLGKPAVVKDSEIELIKKFLKEFESVKVSENKLDIDSSVIINEGVLMNYKGIVIEVVGKKAKVLIKSMSVCLTAIFDKASLQKIDTVA
jgi:transcription antitermination factor NusG